MPDELPTPQAAAYLQEVHGIRLRAGAQTLRNWQVYGGGPPFRVCEGFGAWGPATYRTEDLDAWALGKVPDSAAVLPNPRRRRRRQRHGAA